MGNGDSILILADPNGNAWDFAKQVYEKLITQKEKDRVYKLGEVEITYFNDKELFVRLKENVRKKTCFFIQDSSMNPQAWLVSTALVNDALMRSSAEKINNVLPYLKFSRQDRMADPRTPISTSVVADLLGRNARRVLTTDLHNPATTGSYRIPFDNLRAYPVIISYIKEKYPEFLENAVILAPDAGSAQRAESYAKRLNLPIAIAHKKRQEAGVIGEMTVIGNIENKNVLVVDDMIDTGGTLCKAASVLKEKGAKKIWACATHGIFSNNAVEKLNNSCFEKIIVTDSIPQKGNGKIEIVSLTGLFSEAIHRIAHGLSISELYL